MTPLITHAVEVLRAAIPAGKTGFHVSVASGQIELYDPSFTDRQMAAVWLLISVAAYHQQQMFEAYGEVVSQDDRRIPPELHAAQEHFKDDVQRKLNIEISGYVYDDHLSGASVTIYA